MAEIIRVEGLREFNTKLRKLGKDLPKGLRLAGNEAADIVVRQAKPLVPIGPGRNGHAASSIRVASTRTEARVSAGGKRYPYYPWLDFGGGVGPNKSIRRPFYSDGRYIWKAYGDNRAEIERVLTAALIKVAADAGLDVD